MKIHPHDLCLRDLVDSLPDERQQTLRHLLTCDSCRGRLLPLLKPRSASLARLAEFLRWTDEPSDYDRMIAQSDLAHDQRLFSFERERAQAEGLLGELLAQPRERRLLVLQNRPRFHTWGLLELLIERGREASYADPVKGEELGNLALRLAEHLDVGHYGGERVEDLKARAWAGIGNSRRVRADLSGAEVAMAEALAHLQSGTGDLLERAIVLDLRASLLRAQRRFDQALRLLERAIKIFLEYGDTHRAGRALLNMGNVHHAAGTPEKGIPLLYRAIELIDTHEEPLLVLAVWHNLIDDLAEAGRCLEAHRLFMRAQSIYRRFPDAPTQNRYKWVQGKIARGLGQSAEAEALLIAARDGFLSAESSYDTALVSLDLASLYAAQGRTPELKALAEQMFPVFASQGIHREAIAAILFLRQAIVAEQASLELVTRIAGYLKRAQHDPELRFEAPC